MAGGLRVLGAAAAAVAIGLAGGARAAVVYGPINPVSANKTVVLTGHDLTIPQLIDIARNGAKVRMAPEAIQRAKDTHGLFLEAAAEGVQVYLFNRGGGNNREVSTLTGDPTTPENRAKIEAGQLRTFQNGPRSGEGPEIQDEETVRAMMAVRLNIITSDAPSPQLVQGLVDLLNNGITPVTYSAHGTVGEADISMLLNVAGTLVGRGEVHVRGVRMPAAEALAKAGLKPIQPFGADFTALTSSNAFTASQAALLVSEARADLEWTDLIYGMDLLGMNSSITPLSRPTQANRPEKWLNWHADRMLTLLRGSYLFDVDAKRIIQDPDSLRASSIRQASAWEAWAELRDAALMQINSSDHNPTIRVGLKPTDSWELATPQMMQYYVKGGPLSGGKSGYIVSTANWDPYPLANRVEAFTLALANVDVGVVQRIYRFAYPFHTGVAAADVLSADQRANAAPQANGTTIVSLWGEVESQINPVPPTGIASDNTGNGDIESQIQLKVAKGRAAVRASMRLLAHDLMTAAYWMDVRKVQSPQRSFGPVATAAYTAFREAMPWQLPPAQRPDRPAPIVAFAFMRSHPAASFYPATGMPAR